MDDEKRGNPHGFVTHGECVANTKFITGQLQDLKEDIGRVTLALYGSEGRRGLVRDVNTLLQRSVWSDRIGYVVISIAASVITAYIIGVALKGG